MSRRWPPLGRALGFLILLAALALGCTWLAEEVSRGLQSGRESDLHRRWVVSQYVRRGINPYPITFGELYRAYGPLGPSREKPRVYAIPRQAGENSAVDEAARPLLTSYGTPEAVYPPSTDLLLSLTLGALPEGWVHRAGTLANLLLLTVCIVLFGRLPKKEGSPSVLGFAAAAALMLAWSPTLSTIYAEQFSLLVTVCLLLAFQSLDRHEYLAGACFALALIKPTMALPFLFFPLVRGRWRALLMAASLHLAALAVQCVRFRCSPRDLLQQWTAVAAYFSGGQYTLQEALCALRLADTPAEFALLAGFLLIVLAWCVLNRAATDESLIDLLCIVSILWNYHGPYDFVILLIPIARRLIPLASAEMAGSRRWLAASPVLVFFACVSLATDPRVYGDEIHLGARIVRHATRLVLAFCLVAMAAEVWRASRAASKASVFKQSCQPLAESYQLATDSLCRQSF